MSRKVFDFMVFLHYIFYNFMIFYNNEFYISFLNLNLFFKNFQKLIYCLVQIHCDFDFYRYSFDFPKYEIDERIFLRTLLFMFPNKSSDIFLLTTAIHTLDDLKVS